MSHNRGGSKQHKPPLQYGRMKALVLETWDLHLAYLGCYGCEWASTPTFDRLAAQAVVFDQHYASCLGASRSVWTGRYHLPGLEDKPATISAPGLDLAACLAAGGVAFEALGPPGGRKLAGQRLLAAFKETLAAVLEAVKGRASQERWLLWVDLPSLQPPWALPKKWLGRYFTAAADQDAGEDEQPAAPFPEPPVGRADFKDFALWHRVQLTFGGVVACLDAVLGRLLKALEKHGLDDLLLVVTAERGLALGEHGVLGNDPPLLHDELLHLPLILRLPGRAEAGRRISALTQPLDLMPTLLDFFELPCPPVHGQSLWPLVHGQAEQARPFACAGAQAGESPAWALRTLAWSLMLPVATPRAERPEPSLFVKPEDRWEVNDVRQHHLDLAENLEIFLRNFVAATRQPEPLPWPALAEALARITEGG
jgi:arylsulfatase A-like enzyme